ncbi:hypothetical protein LZC95_34050 [Pendulispora brunnea]|uniref:Periplasmic heavy metal sensor n=1 Tax=Pendulispora brunnea TaxID=2905690 RepID=A0ABZ2JY86_9BACT
MRSFRLAILGVMLATSMAFAQPEKGKGAPPPGHVGPGKHEKEDKGPPNKGEPTSAKNADDDEDDDIADGGKPGDHRRTPAQLTFRRGLWERRQKAIEALVHKGGKHLTDDERDLIRQHWLRLGMLMRIRELAQEAHDDAVIKRVDAAIEREEKRSEAKLEKLSAKVGGTK